MHSRFPQYALTIAAALMRMVWGGLRARLGFSTGDQMIDNWVHGILSRFDALLAQYRAGELPPVLPPRVAVGRGANAGQAARVLTLAEVAALLAASPVVETMQRCASHVAGDAPKRAGWPGRVVARCVRSRPCVQGDCGGSARGYFRKIGLGAA